MTETINGCDALIPSVSIEALLARREQIVKQMRTVGAMIDEMHKLQGFGMEIPRAEWVGRYQYSARLSSSSFANVMSEIDAGAWRYLMDQSGLWSLMDAQARSDWNNRIANREVPPLTRDNIRETFGSLHAARVDIFERGIINAFKRLSWDYKTNNPIRFGRRIVVERVVEIRSGMPFFAHAACNELDDLRRLFFVLDGEPEPDHRNGGMFHELTRAWKDGNHGTADQYLALRWFKKGTAHVTFHRPDLVEGMNAILARHHPNALPPSR